MNTLIMAGQLITGLAILVTLHELGHFLAARAFGIKVEKFYLFFDAWGFKLFSFKRGETEYGIGWLPLGGYVKIAGMIDESMDTEQMAKAPEPWEFRAKPAWQRLIVMVAGVTMNVLLGIIIFSFSLLEFKQEYLSVNEVNKGDGIYAYSLGRELGFQNGDKIIAINGEKFDRFDDVLSSRIMFGATITIQRSSQTMEIEVPSNFYRTVSKVGRMNFIGYGYQKFAISTIAEKSPAAKAGFKAGDEIISVKGEKILDTDDLKAKVAAHCNTTIVMEILRDKKPMTLSCIVRPDSSIGIGYFPQPIENGNYKMTPYTFASAFKFGTSDAMEALVSNVKGLRKIFTGQEKASDSVQGPIGIAQIYGSTWEWPKFWAITGLLSMVLAFMNILPIPALDGGHVVFLTIESITRKKFSDKFMERAQIVGMIILLSLMVFSVANDIWKHILN
ncbi:MAG: RIP metalloprotease RseP [Bacteroidota bacterium]